MKTQSYCSHVVVTLLLAARHSQNYSSHSQTTETRRGKAFRGSKFTRGVTLITNKKDGGRIEEQVRALRGTMVSEPPLTRIDNASLSMGAREVASDFACSTIEFQARAPATR